MSWRVRYKMKKGPWNETPIREASSEQAWKAWGTYKITENVGDYHTVEAYAE